MSMRELNSKHVEMTAQIRHHEFLQRVDGGFHADPLEVSRIAAKLASLYYTAEIVDSPTDLVEKTRCIGLLVYAMDAYGMCFETVVANADIDVAHAVAELSSDLRLPPGPRLNHHCSTIARAGASSQLVRLAEILVVLNGIASDGDRLDEPYYFMSLKQWGDDAVALLEVLCHLKKHQKFTVLMVEAKGKIAQRIAETRVNKQARKQARKRREAAEVDSAAEVADNLAIPCTV